MTNIAANSRSRPGYFPALTGIRAISAYMVYIHPFSEELIGRILFKILKETHIGVSVFFVFQDS